MICVVLVFAFVCDFGLSLAVLVRCCFGFGFN